MEDPQPLMWQQLNASVPRRRRSPPWPFLSLPVLIILLPVVVLLFAFFIVPSFLSITSQILRPNSVRKSWDSLNEFLVLVAILCGVLARRNDDGSSQQPSSYGEDDRTTVTNIAESTGDDSKSLSVSQQWFTDPYEVDRLKIYESVSRGTPSVGLPATGSRQSRRSSSSYPDLRQGAPQETGNYRFRFFDDFELRSYRSQSDTSDDRNEFQNKQKVQIEESEAKEIPVDTFELLSSSPMRKPQGPPPPPPPPPPSAAIKQKSKWMHHSGRSKETRETTRDSSEVESCNIKHKSPLAAPPPPPPPPPPPTTAAKAARASYKSERKNGRSVRRKSNATREIKMVLASLYNQRKRKRKSPKEKNNNCPSHENHQRNDSPITETPPDYYSTIPPPSPAPPPPPPPPPPPRQTHSVFYGLFKKGSKSKKIHSIPAPPPPPPPPQPSTRSWKRKIRAAAAAVQSAIPPPAPPPPPAPATPPRRRPGRPPLPTRRTDSHEENLNSGGQSPLIPIQPPAPPFKIPEMKFVFRGDFAKIRSNQSSICGSPERDEIDLSLEIGESEKISRSDGGGGSAFCPSPDVNIKADSFIARLRDEWRLEKINSAREKRKMVAS